MAEPWLEPPLLSPPVEGGPHSAVPCGTLTPPLCWINSCCPMACPQPWSGCIQHCIAPQHLMPGPGSPWHPVTPQLPRGLPDMWGSHGVPVQAAPQGLTPGEALLGVCPTIPRTELGQSKLWGAEAVGAQQTLHTHPNTPPLPAGMHGHSCADRQGKAQVHRCTRAQTIAHRCSQAHRGTVRQRERHRCTYTQRGTHRQTDRQAQQMHGHTAACTPGTHTGGFPWGDVHKQTHSPVRLRADTGSHVWQHRENRNESTRRRVCTHTEGQGKDLGQGMSHAALWGSGTGAG